MKRLSTLLFAILSIVLITSCNNPPQQQYYQQPVAVQQPVQQVQGDPNQFYNDPQYANQQPVQYVYNGQQILIDAALMAYLYTYHIDPGYYYSTHRSYSHFHVYSNGYYSGYARGYHPTYVSYNHYHYSAPNARYVTHTYTRTSISQPVRSQRSFGTRTVAPVRSGGFGRSSSGSFHSSYHSSGGHHR